MRAIRRALVSLAGLAIRAGALRVIALAAIALLAIARPARGDEPGLSDAEILGPPKAEYSLESVRARFTHIDQTGHGFQSRAGPKGGPGSERLWVQEPQLEVVWKQGERLTHRLWIPVDIVTAASPDAIDVVSGASRSNEAGSFDWTTTYEASRRASVFVRAGFHSEENYVSWNLGFGGKYSLADDNTVLSASGNQVVDWFDKYALKGKNIGHTTRTSTNGNVGVTQLLSPTTVVHLDYGLTIQQGELSNTWNIVPLVDGTNALEVLPKQRTRHAIVGRVAQWLPWNGAFKGSYRFYADDWGISAHTFEFELDQRLSHFSYVGLFYRAHAQTAADFFYASREGARGESHATAIAGPTTKPRTADSDLEGLFAQSIGVKGVFDFRSPFRFARTMHFDLGFERYSRSNDLAVIVYSCGLGFLL